MKSSNQLSRDLNQAQKKLSDFLGEEITEYYSLLKSWFKGKLSKNEFDLQARNLVPHEKIHLHNNFLLTLLSKCGNFDPSMEATGLEGKTSRVRKKFKKSFIDEVADDSDSVLLSGADNAFQQFRPADPFSNTPQIPDQALTSKFREFSSKISLSLLPTRPLIHCRLFVGAWERKLEGVTDECVDLLHQAVFIFLKNILQALASHKHGFQVHQSHPHATATGLDTFVHSIGAAPPTLSLLPSLPSHLLDPSFSHSSTDPQLHIRDEQQSRKPQCQSFPHKVTLFDLLELLQTRKGVIGSSSLGRVLEERLIHKLFHPSEQLEAAERALKSTL